MWKRSVFLGTLGVHQTLKLVPEKCNLIRITERFHKFCEIVSIADIFQQVFRSCQTSYFNIYVAINSITTCSYHQSFVISLLGLIWYISIIPGFLQSSLIIFQKQQLQVVRFLTLNFKVHQCGILLMRISAPLHFFKFKMKKILFRSLLFFHISIFLEIYKIVPPHNGVCGGICLSDATSFVNK